MNLWELVGLLAAAVICLLIARALRRKAHRAVTSRDPELFRDHQRSESIARLASMQGPAAKGFAGQRERVAGIVPFKPGKSQ